MSTKRCPMCGTPGGWELPGRQFPGRVIHATEFPCGTKVETVGDFGVGKTVASESATCLRWQRDRMARKVNALRKLVEEAYEEGADDALRDAENFTRSNAQATLRDIDNQ